MEELVRQYQGFSRSIDNNGKRTTEILKGFKEQCEEYILTLRIRTNV